ncbi:MAG: hypothetical protein Q8P25_00290 [Candidatus Curtissbacteria bacterium]|nr:hypothetical protein [Candidatus Curtissbacteria bacterium]
MVGESISKASLRVSRDRFSSFVFVFSLLCLLLQSSLILVSWGKLPPQVPIFYSRPWGEIILAAPFWLWLLPGILLMTLIVNWVFAIFFVSSERFLVRVLLLFNLVISTATLYDVVKIISLLT